MRVHWPPPNKVGEEKQARVKKGQAGNCQQNEARRRNPMVCPRARRIAVHDHRIAWVDGITLFDVIRSHDQRSPARRLASSSSLGWTLLGPDTKWWKTPIAAKAPIAARPAYFVRPFQNSTIGLILGSSGSSA